MMTKFKFSIVASACLLVLGCGAGKNKTNVELVQDMMDQINVKAQDWDPKRPGKPTMLTPPEGTVPIGHKVYPYSNPLEAEKKLKNPYKDDFSPEFISRGKEHYEI